MASLSAPAAGRRDRSRGDLKIIYLFLLPTIVLLIGMNAFPLLWSLVLSFTNYGAGTRTPHWVGTANYHDILRDPNMWHNFQVTAAFVVLAVGCEFLIGFGLALLLNRKFPGKEYITPLLLLPMMLSPVVVGRFWSYIFEASYGVLNYLLQLAHAGWRVDWFAHANTAMAALVIVDTWMWSPFMMLISLAGLSAIPQHLYEAAAIDRASGWFKFRHITLPMVAPLLLIAFLFRTMDAFKLFDIAYVLTEGGPGDSTQTVSLALYRMAFRFWDTGASCALAYIVLIIIIALSNIYIRVLNRVQGTA